MSTTLKSDRFGRLVVRVDGVVKGRILKVGNDWVAMPHQHDQEFDSYFSTRREAILFLEAR